MAWPKGRKRKAGRPKGSTTQASKNGISKEGRQTLEILLKQMTYEFALAIKFDEKIDTKAKADMIIKLVNLVDQGAT